MMKDPETTWEARNFETVCAHDVCHHLKHSTEKEMLNAEKTPGPLACPPKKQLRDEQLFWYTAWCVSHAASRLALPWCCRDLLVLYHLHAVQSKKKTFLIAHFGNVHPLSDGGCSKCFLTNWETKEMN